MMKTTPCPANPGATPSVEDFDQQFRRQISAGDFALNPFETAALPHLRGEVLDFGCGLGNLALRAAQLGHPVLALDASPAAIEHLQKAAAESRLPLRAEQADLRTTQLEATFDSVVSIGLLMFFDCPSTVRQLEHLKSRVAPGGIAVINLLIEGTTFMDMLSRGDHCLFRAGELASRFAGWNILANERTEFPAPGNTLKVFETVIAGRPPAA